MIVAAAVTLLVLALAWIAVVLVPLPWWLAAFVTAGAALLWAAVVLQRVLRARKAAREIERAVSAGAAAQAQDARPDQQAEIGAMQAEFEKAVSALKSSKLGRGGADALAVLPWYVIIGPPGSGKSTALRASGLRFPYLSKRGGVRGLGGTRNCEWWLTNDAVLLDTAGRYTTEEDDHDEWVGFLDLLHRTRPRKPLNGVIVAISVADLAAETEEGAAELGRRMRERVDEVMGRLQLVLPLYVLFTKADLLPGFVEAFAELRKNERGQIWGVTLPLAEEGDRAAAFAEGLDELVESLEERVLRRLGEERTLHARERIYELPQQLAAIRPAIGAFVEALVAENVYQDTPILRGGYFTSGTQEGRTLDRVMGAMAEAFGIRPALEKVEPVLEPKSYFLKDVFSGVVFKDQAVAFRSAKAVKRDAIRRGSLAGVAAALAVVVLALLLRSYVGNRELLARVGQAADEAAARVHASRKTGGAPPLAALEPLRAHVETLARAAREGVPLSMGLGMYGGDEVLPSVSALYGTAVRDTIVGPAAQRDQDDMKALVARLAPSPELAAPEDMARLYGLLKLHLLLSPMRGGAEPPLGEAEQRFVAEALADRAGTRSSPGAPPDPVQANAAAYAQLLAGDPALGIARNAELVAQVRRVLSKARFADLALTELEADPGLRDHDLSLTAMLGGPSTVLTASRTVRGAYTARGYDEVMKARLDDPGAIVEPWVLSADAQAGATRARAELEELRSRYFERYVQEWRRFLDSVAMRPPGDLLPVLEELTQRPTTPLERLFSAIADNTRLASKDPTRRIAENLTAKLRAVGAVASASAAVSTAALGGPARYGPKDVEGAFEKLVAFGWAPPVQGGAARAQTPLDIYQEQLGYMREAMQRERMGGDPTALAAKALEASGKIQPLVASVEGWKEFLDAVLMAPVNQAGSIGNRNRIRPIAQEWCGSVAPFFKKAIASRYPFTRGGEDAALGDVQEFFRPGGVLWGFYDRALQPVVVRTPSGFQFAPGQPRPPVRGELLGFLKRAQEVSSALFPANASTANVPVKIRIRPTPKVAAVFLNVDGQRIEYRNGPEEWYPIAWPGASPGASLRVRTADGREESILKEGDWAFFRLLEAGSLRGEPGALDFTMTWSLPGLGVTITADVRASRTDSPFLASRRVGPARLLEPMHAPLAAPATIGDTGGGCQ